MDVLVKLMWQGGRFVSKKRLLAADWVPGRLTLKHRVDERLGRPVTVARLDSPVSTTDEPPVPDLLDVRLLWIGGDDMTLTGLQHDRKKLRWEPQTWLVRVVKETAPVPAAAAGPLSC